MKKTVAMLIAVVSPLVVSASAYAERPAIPGEQTLGNDQFLIHFAPGGDADAQSALATLTSVRPRIPAELGLPAPPDDRATDPSGDPRLDAYLVPIGMNVHGRTYRGGSVPEGEWMDAASSYFYLFPPYDTHTFAHEYFHSFQLGLDGGEVNPEGWWAELTAEWAAFRLAGDDSSALPSYVTDLGTYATKEMICEGDPGSTCYDNPYEWWPLAEFMSTQLGPSVVAEIWQEQARLGAGSRTSHAREAIDNVLERKGTTLDQLFAQFAAAAAWPRFGIFSTVPVPHTFGWESIWMEHPRVETSFQLQPWTIQYARIEKVRRGSKLVVRVDGTYGPAPPGTALLVLRTGSSTVTKVKGNRGPAGLVFKVKRTNRPHVSEQIVLAIPNGSDLEEETSVVAKVRRRRPRG